MDYKALSRADLIERLRALEMETATNELHTVERKRDRTALHDSEELLRAIFETAVEGIITIDERGVVESFNPAAERMFGYQAAEVIGQNVSVLMPMPYRHEHDGYVSNYLRTGKARIIGAGREVVGQRKDRSIFPMDLSVSEVRFESRRLFAGFVRDVSERKASERASRHFGAIVQNSGDAIVSKNLEGVIESWNQGAEDLFGYAAEEIIGRSILTIIPPSRHSEEREILEQIREGRRIKHYETIRQRKDGSLVDVSLMVSPIKNEGGEIIGVSKIARDIGDRKRLEREVLEISERERRSIGHTLHDGLSQHLAGIELMSQVLEQNIAKKSKPAAAQAGKIAERVREAIVQTRMLARGLSPVGIEADGIVSALKDLTATVSELFQITCRFSCDDPLEINDNALATHLYRIAQEAINNAIKHGKARAVRIRLRHDSQSAQLMITDDGVGFPKQPVKHAGMGLQIMKYRAGMIGATLEIRAAKPKGSSVVCTFPLKTAL